MIPPIHPDNRNGLWQEVVILIAILILIAAFCSEPVVAQDVKIGLTELKPSLYTDEQGKPTGFFEMGSFSPGNTWGKVAPASSSPGRSSRSQK